jgi:hypothetical protein
MTSNISTRANALLQGTLRVLNEYATRLLLGCHPEYFDEIPPQRPGLVKPQDISRSPRLAQPTQAGR